MKNNRIWKIFCLQMAKYVSVCLLLIGLLFVPVRDAVAEDFSWVNASGGAFEELSNWTVGGSPASALPTAVDKIVNFVTGEYTVTLDADTVVDSLLVNVGYVSDDTTVTLDMGGHALDVGTGFSVIDVRDGLAKLILTNGLLRCDQAYGWTTLTGLSVAYACGNNRSGRLAIVGPETSVQGVGNLLVAGVGSELAILAGAHVQMGGMLRLHETEDRVQISGNGTFVGLGDQLQINGTGSRGHIEDGASLTAQGAYLGDASNLMLRVDNATMTLTNKVFNIGYRCKNSLVVVTNQAVVSASQGIQMTGNSPNPSVNARLVVADGGRVLVPDGKKIEVGKEYSRDAKLELDNGHVETGFLEIGSHSSPAGTSSNSLLRISGESSLLKVTNVLTYDFRHSMFVRYGARVEFIVPQDGFLQTPIQLIQGPLVTMRSTIPGYEDVPNTLFVDANDWAKAHPGETITLISCGRDSSVGFAELIEHATFSTRYPGRLCTLSVGGDGQSLLLTAPHEAGTVLSLR